MSYIIYKYIGTLYILIKNSLLKFVEYTIEVVGKYIFNCVCLLKILQMKFDLNQ